MAGKQATGRASGALRNSASRPGKSAAKQSARELPSATKGTKPSPKKVQGESKVAPGAALPKAKAPAKTAKTANAKHPAKKAQAPAKPGPRESTGKSGAAKPPSQPAADRTSAPKTGGKGHREARESKAQTPAAQRSKGQTSAPKALPKGASGAATRPARTTPPKGPSARTAAVKSTPKRTDAQTPSPAAALPARDQLVPKPRSTLVAPAQVPEIPEATASGTPEPGPFQPPVEALSPPAEAHPGPSVPKGPFAHLSTEELWVLYRREADRLRIAEKAGPGEPAEELDEEAELRRLEAEEAAARAREEALARGEIEEPEIEEPENGEQRAQADPVALVRGKKERNSPELERLRNELIERHYPLVRYIAERLLQTLPKSIELDDLVSAGQFGLMDAIRGFDPSRGIKFKTYCSTRIRGSILDQLRSQDWVPRLVRLKATRIDKALQRLTGEFGREPTHAELARALEMEHGDLSREIMDAQARTMFSLSEKWDDDDEGSVEKVEILEDRTAIDPVHELNRRDLMGFMTRSLTHKERFIIEQYYQYGHTMREIGEMLALTESRVCQIHSNVMGRLKNLLAQRSESLSE